MCAGGHSVHPKASADGCDTARAGGGDPWRTQPTNAITIAGMGLAV